MNAMTIDSQVSDRRVQVSTLRDTGCTQSLLLSSKMHRVFQRHICNCVGISRHTVSVPLYRLLLQTRNLYPKTQEVLIGLSYKLPVPGVDLLLDNNLCDGCVVEPIVSKVSVHSSSTEVLLAFLRGDESYAEQGSITGPV